MITLDNNDFVITGKKAGANLTDLQHPWRRIRKIAELEDVRLHDLRHSFASHGLVVGEGLPMIGKLLGHTQIQTTARYAHLANDPIEAAADRIAGRISASTGNITAKDSSAKTISGRPNVAIGTLPTYNSSLYRLITTGQKKRSPIDLTFADFTWKANTAR